MILYFEHNDELAMNLYSTMIHLTMIDLSMILSTMILYFDNDS